VQRLAFRTSRLSDFCGVDELTKQCGHAPEEWPLVILKELVDNGLDSCEETDVAPEITIVVSTARGEITVSDNGPGLPADTITDVLDFSVRVSSREAYVSPSRGQQGNALKTILAMAFALDGAEGRTLIHSHGMAREVVFRTDPIRREPRIAPLLLMPSDVKTGTRITLRWPLRACDMLVAAKPRFLQIARNYTAFNPHLRLLCEWDDESLVDCSATDRGWCKWRTCDPTSAHWYTIEQCARYFAAHIARDQDNGESARTVRDFIAEFDGLSGSGKQKLVLEESGAARVKLAEFFDRGRDAIAVLLKACQNHTRAPKPETLGIIGSEHFLAECHSRGGLAGSFQYRRHLMVFANLPYVIETAFAYCPRASERLIAIGINSSAAIDNPLPRFGYYQSLDSVLAEQHVTHDSPIKLMMHVGCPHVTFADRGKSATVIPQSVNNEIRHLIELVTQRWAKQRRAELRLESAIARRLERLQNLQERPAKPAPPAPEGVLAEKITAAAASCCLPVRELCVLSPENDPYTSWKRRRQAEWFAELFGRLVPPDRRRHLRGFFYLLVSQPTPVLWLNGKPFVNDYKHWQAMQKAANAARWLGLIPFKSIIDERNAQSEIYVPPVTTVMTSITSGTAVEIAAELAEALPQFTVSGFTARQTHRIIFYGEKSSLAEVLRPIAEEIGAEMIIVVGESSNTRIQEAAERLVADGRPGVLLYFSDFDPSGHQMPISVARKLQALRDLCYPNLNIRLYQVALTIEQVRSLGLPSAPLKDKEKRSAKWRAAFDGHEQTEIDALVELHPDVLRQATYDAIRPFYDFTLNDRVRRVGDDWRIKANRALARKKGYHSAVERIKTAWEQARVAIEDLTDEQKRAADALRKTIPPAPALPEAKPAGDASCALFDSTDDFIAATRRLRQHKKLDFDDEEDD